VRFSIWPSPSQPAADVVATARHAEATGWDGVWISDHFMGDDGSFGSPETPTLEATALLAGLATATERVRLGSLVFGTTYRHPAVLANWAVTVDHLSGGRLVLGLGAGWQENEHEQYGIDLPSARDRVDRFAEVCEVTRSLLERPRTDVDGRWFTLTGALCEPKPVQPRLPLLIGAKGDRMIGVVARHADEWNMWGMPEVVAERMAVLDAACEAVDRDPATIARSTQALVLVTDDPAAAAGFVEVVAPRAAVAGTPARIAETVARWQAAGIDELIVPDFVLGSGAAKQDAMDALIAELRPSFG
jgi:alkanesulfonate monooxygenase SsuD/methylene tetrahydromethanopterin reductase-like flavin-dependent oxidoreductase (luciferase family)